MIMGNIDLSTRSFSYGWLHLLHPVFVRFVPNVCKGKVNCYRKEIDFENLQRKITMEIQMKSTCVCFALPSLTSVMTAF